MNLKQINRGINLMLFVVEDVSKLESDNNKIRNFEFKRLVSIKIKKWCWSFAFNTNSTILFVGQNNSYIKVLGLNSKTKLMQTFFSLAYDIVCLIWRKKSNSLITGLCDKIVIYNNNQLRPIQILQPDCKILKCLILNEDEDIMVSGGSNPTIQFWQQKAQTWVCSQILETSTNAECFSFNSQNKLILSAVFPNLVIQVIEQQNNQNWIITQTIIIGYVPNKFFETNGSPRVYFINDDLFAYQLDKDWLEIYDYNLKNNQFVMALLFEIDVYNCNFFLSCQFFLKRNIQIAKNIKNRDFFLGKNMIKLGISKQLNLLRNQPNTEVTWDGAEEYKIAFVGNDLNYYDGDFYHFGEPQYKIQIRKIKYYHE